MLRCRDGSYYTGVTSEIDARVAQHELGVFQRCYTYRRRPVKLVYAEVFSDPEAAIFAERRRGASAHPSTGLRVTLGQRHVANDRGVIVYAQA
jgi:GIY-YIG catalytic domain-containing protein